jgi:hypothetical protein
MARDAQARRLRVPRVFERVVDEVGEHLREPPLPGVHVLDCKIHRDLDSPFENGRSSFVKNAVDDSRQIDPGGPRRLCIEA